MKIEDFKKAKLIQQRIENCNDTTEHLKSLYSRHKNKSLTSQDIEQLFNYADQGVQNQKEYLQKEFDAL